MEINSLLGVRVVPARDRRRHVRIPTQAIAGILHVSDKGAIAAHLMEVAMARVERTRAKLAAETAELEDLLREIGSDGGLSHD
jgi:hypothetical protein